MPALRENRNSDSTFCAKRYTHFFAMTIDARRFAKDLTVILNKWTDEIEAIEREREKYPMNHVYYRIYTGILNQQHADLNDIVGAIKRNTPPL